MTFLKSVPQLFCRPCLTLCLTDVFLMIKFKLHIFGKDIIEALLCPSHCTIPVTYDIDRVDSVVVMLTLCYMIININIDSYNY